MLSGARRLPLRPSQRLARRALHPWRVLLAVLALVSAVAAHAQPAGHCFAVSEAGGCASGRVTDAQGILLPGTHVYFAGPTRRYAHGVLGDDVEWGRLVYVQQGSAAHGPYLFMEIFLPPSRVFEDLTPRLYDLDGDGQFEIVVVESEASSGAQLSVYGLRDLRLVQLAATPHIGRANRWLAPLGAADLDGDGAVEIAYIDRPHLAKTLRIWRYADGGLEPVAQAPGLSNHRIGWDYITGGIRDCGAGPEIVTASGDWQRLMAARLLDGQIALRDLGRYSPEAEAAALDCAPE